MAQKTITRNITIELRTLKGFNKAERLQSYGWKVSEVGFNTITMTIKQKPIKIGW